MKILIVYDSTYGNTERIAKAIGGAITGEVKVLRVSEVSPSALESIDLLILGSPIQGFRPTKAVQALIDSVPGDTLKGISVAAFDTRLPAAERGRGLRLLLSIGGYAAPRMAQALKKKGGNLIAAPEGFFVKEREGPLAEGELERAAAWAKEIASAKEAS